MNAPAIAKIQIATVNKRKPFAKSPSSPILSGSLFVVGLGLKKSVMKAESQN
jgi:hypothetical protein